MSLSSIDDIINGILYRLYKVDSVSNLQETLIEQLTTIVHAIGRYLVDHLKSILKVICDFFDPHLQVCLNLIESLCLVVHEYEVDIVLAESIPSMLRTIKVSRLIYTYYILTIYIYYFLIHTFFSY